VTDELHPGVIGRSNRRDYARPVWESGKQFLGVGFHAIESLCVLIEKHEKYDSDGHKPGELPLLGPETGQYAKAEDGRDGGEPENQKSNPAPVQRWAKIFWKKSGCTDGDEIELRWEDQ
jgi:hypothetical protein